jgi:hypothetical protein
MIVKGHYGAESHGVVAAMPYHLHRLVRRGDVCDLAEAVVTGYAERKRIANPSRMRDRLPAYATSVGIRKRQRTAALHDALAQHGSPSIQEARPPSPAFARLFMGGAGQMAFEKLIKNPNLKGG